jgi:hypothetical protein
MKLKKGTYWIGDPCYVYPHDEWQEFCGTLFCGKIDEHIAAYGKRQFFVTSTAYGDGCYALKRDGKKVSGELGVDAGLLSIIPKALVRLWHPKDNEADRLGIWVTLDKDEEVTVPESGIFVFGPYSVNTKDDEGEE